VTEWNFADVWETIAEHLPEAPALVHGDRRISWGEMNRRASSLAKTLVGAGGRHQDKVAQYLYNCPEYMESAFAALKAGLVPVNTNYRYGDDELVYLWDNADAFCVVFHGVFTERATRLRSRVPKVKEWIWVDDGTSPCPDWAIPYDEAAGDPSGSFEPPWERSGDDLLLLYTGGTTGMPKGVMWRQDDLFRRLNAGNLVKLPEDEGLEGIKRTISGPGFVHLPACPLMHGTGLFTSLAMLDVGGCIVTLTSRSFDATELLDTVDREHVNTIAIVGDAFAKPILAALDAEPDRWSLSTLLAFISSGVMWSEQTKEGLLHHKPTLLLVDAFSSSEALGMGVSVSSGTKAERTAHFTLGPDVKVIDPDTLKDVVPGSGQVGVLALGGRNPLGYYKDPEKSAATFKKIDGVVYSIPGDWATVESDGAITLLGRGSVCINTGGEKVFPEEVEEVIKLHPAVRDAVAVGLADERFGEVVAAAVELRPGAEATEQEIIDHVKARLAGYKAPKRVRFVDSIGRAPTGKVDYGRHHSEMAEWASRTTA
jgi:acyl-CoA synthetase (AMP-forming)/AMP-acid ligase II